MTMQIQLKIGPDSNIGVVQLSVGEPAFTTDTGKLYIGDETNKVLINPMDKPSRLDTENTYTRLKVNEYGQVVELSNLAAADIPEIPSTQVTGLGTAALVNTGTSESNIPLLDANGDVPLSTIPNIPFTQITGLGTVATANTGTSPDNVPVLDSTSKLPTSVIPDISYSQITGLGTSATKDVGTAAGNIPILDGSGKLETSTLPAIAITNTFTVSSEAEMLALTADTGDIAIRTDLYKNFILKQSPASTLSNWTELLTPTDSVTSVNSKTGAVVLSGSDIILTDYTKAANYTPIVDTDSTLLGIGKLEKNFGNYAPLNSPALTGSPTATQMPNTDNSTRIATSGFVRMMLTIFKTPLKSPNIKNDPTAPTPPLADKSTRLSTTANVKGLLNVIDGGSF